MNTFSRELGSYHGANMVFVLLEPKSEAVLEGDVDMEIKDEDESDNGDDSDLNTRSHGHDKVVRGSQMFLSSFRQQPSQT
jgi:hypothetical protein